MDVRGVSEGALVDPNGSLGSACSGACIDFACMEPPEATDAGRVDTAAVAWQTARQRGPQLRHLQWSLLQGCCAHPMTSRSARVYGVMECCGDGMQHLGA